MTTPTPDVARITLRAAFACVVTDLVLVALIALLGFRDGVSWSLAPTIWAYAVGHGLGAAVALAIAETVLHYRGLVCALAAGLLCSCLAPLGGAFELAFFRTWSVPDATREVVDGFPSIALGEWALHAAGAASFLVPLLVAISRRARRSTQALAMAGGALIWCCVRLAWPEARPSLIPGLCGVLAVGPALILPPARGLGDLLVARLLGREGRASPRRAPRRSVCVLGLVGLALVVGGLEGPNEIVGTAILRSRARLGDREAMLRLADLLSGRVVVAPLPTKPALPDMGWALQGHGVDTPVTLEFPRVTDGASFRLYFAASRASARHWYRTAACHGDPEAMVRLADLLLERSAYHMGMKSIPHDDLPEAIADVQEALSWLRQAAVAGHAEAAAELGKCLSEGWTTHHRGVNFALGGPPSPQRREEGARWLRFAAERR